MERNLNTDKTNGLVKCTPQKCAGEEIPELTAEKTKIEKITIRT
jgi:hypothetical protein